jgi:hypothetical protein
MTSSKDFATACFVAEKLGYTDLLRFVYEEWCFDYLKTAQENDWSIHAQIRNKFSDLAQKIALSQGISQV